MRHLIYISLSILLTLSLSLVSCKKARFNNYNNELIIELPSLCDDCSLVVYMDGADLTTTYPAAGNVHAFEEMSYVNYAPNGDNEFNIELNWEDILSTYADPTKDITFALFNDLYSLGNGRTMIYSKTVRLKPRRVYKWDPEADTFEATGEKTKKKKDSGSSSNPLVGKWMESGTCANVNGESNYIEFYSNGSGRSFSADCNSTCANFGVFFHFSYTDSGSSFSLNFTSVSDYCGVSGNVPAGGTSSYSLSGNVLTINGVDHIKQ